MFIRKRLWVISFIIFIISAISFYSVYMHLYSEENHKDSKPKQIVENDTNHNKSNDFLLNSSNNQQFDEIPAVQRKSDRISSSTEMIYQYYYEDRDKVVEEKGKPPYFLIDLTRDELQKTYSDWQVSSFSSEKVIMKKNISSNNAFHYILGVYDGFIAIFHNNERGDSELKEITETPISSLPQEERIKLEKGIIVYGEEELIRMLQDYNS